MTALWLRNRSYCSSNAWYIHVWLMGVFYFIEMLLVIIFEFPDDQWNIILPLHHNTSQRYVESKYPVNRLYVPLMVMYPKIYLRIIFLLSKTLLHRVWTSMQHMYHILHTSLAGKDVLCKFLSFKRCTCYVWPIQKGNEWIYRFHTAFQGLSNRILVVYCSKCSRSSPVGMSSTVARISKNTFIHYFHKPVNSFSFLGNFLSVLSSAWLCQQSSWNRNSSFVSRPCVVSCPCRYYLGT